MLPFTRDQFFAVFAAYNTAIWPLQVLAFVLGVAAVAALWLRPHAGRIVALGALALLWSWTGVVYHIAFFARINPAAVAFGAMFVAQAALLAWYATRTNDLELSHRAPGRAWSWVLVAYSAALYPLIGMWSGHVYPAAPMFGVSPCPLVIFTFGILVFSRARAPWVLFAVPTLWSLIGGSAAFLLGVYQDWALPLSAIIAIAVNARKARR